MLRPSMNLSSSPLPSLHGLSRAELGLFLTERGLSPVHAVRIWSALYWDCVTTWREMEGVPPKVLDALQQTFSLGALDLDTELFSTDGHTRKLLLGLHKPLCVARERARILEHLN